MIKLENVVPASLEQMEFIIQGMRNPMGSIFQKLVKNLKSARISEDVQELEYRLSKPEKRMGP